MSNIRSASKVLKKKLSIQAKRGSKRFMLYCIKTNKHIHAYIYDCEAKNLVSSVSTVSMKQSLKKTWNIDAATKLGLEVVKLCKEKNITDLFFNKLNYPFKGKIAALVNSLRENGLVI